MNGFKCVNTITNEYGEEVCRYTGCPCDCSSRSECCISDCFDGETGDFDD